MAQNALFLVKTDPIVTNENDDITSEEVVVTKSSADLKPACVIQVGSRIIGVLDDPARAGQVCSDLMDQGIAATWSMWTMNYLQSVSLKFGGDA